MKNRDEKKPTQKKCKSFLKGRKTAKGQKWLSPKSESETKKQRLSKLKLKSGTIKIIPYFQNKESFY